MTFEQSLDAIQSAAQRAGLAVATALPREARGDVDGAMAQLAAAEEAILMALGGIAHARGLLKDRAR